MELSWGQAIGVGPDGVASGDDLMVDAVAGLCGECWDGKNKEITQDLVEEVWVSKDQLVAGRQGRRCAGDMQQLSVSKVNMEAMMLEGVHAKNWALDIHMQQVSTELPSSKRKAQR